MANTDAPQFKLSGTQMLALTLIEMQQKQLVAAANTIIERAGIKDAAETLVGCAKALDDAKLRWLKSTQGVLVEPPSELVSRIKANGFAP